MKTSTIVLSEVVNHYLANVFTSVTIPDAQKIDHIEKNALRINLGKNVDHLEYCLYLASNAPYYGVLVKDYSTLTKLKKFHQISLGTHTTVPKTVQCRIGNLPADTEVLVIADATEMSNKKLRAIFNSWYTEKPILLIG